MTVLRERQARHLADLKRWEDNTRDIRDQRTSLYVWSAITVGVGVAMGVVGPVLLSSAYSKDGDVRLLRIRQRVETSPSEAARFDQAAEDLGRTRDIERGLGLGLTIGGGIGVAMAIGLLLSVPALPPKPDGGNTLIVRPAAAPGFTGSVLQVRF